MSAKAVAVAVVLAGLAVCGAWYFDIFGLQTLLSMYAPLAKLPGTSTTSNPMSSNTNDNDAEKLFMAGTKGFPIIAESNVVLANESFSIPANGFKEFAFKTRNDQNIKHILLNGKITVASPYVHVSLKDSHDNCLLSIYSPNCEGLFQVHGNDYSFNSMPLKINTEYILRLSNPNPQTSDLTFHLTLVDTYQVDLNPNAKSDTRTPAFLYQCTTNVSTDSMSNSCLDPREGSNAAHTTIVLSTPDDLKAVAGGTLPSTVYVYGLDDYSISFNGGTRYDVERLDKQNEPKSLP